MWLVLCSGPITICDMVGALSQAYNPINLHRANNLSVCSWVHIGTCAICMSLLNALAAMLCLAHPCSRYKIWSRSIGKSYASPAMGNSVVVGGEGSKGVGFGAVDLCWRALKAAFEARYRGRTAQW